MTGREDGNAHDAVLPIQSLGARATVVVHVVHLGASELRGLEDGDARYAVFVHVAPFGALELRGLEDGGAVQCICYPR